MPKVSIIIPVFNTEKYIAETLKCLSLQTLSDIEILVTDDGSTDNSSEIIHQMEQQDDRIRCYHQENQGQSAARNLAMRHASGDYIYFMDSDDLIDTDALRQCYEYAEETRADFIFFDGNTLLEDGSRELPWNYQRTQYFEAKKPYRGEQLLQQVLDLKKHSCVVWLLFIRRSFLDRINLLFHEGIIHEDELFTAKLTLQSNRVFCLKKSLVTHRVRVNSTMTQRYSRYNVDCYLTVVDELLRFSRTPIVNNFASYTLSLVFYTAHQLPFRDKLPVFWRALSSGYMKYIGLKSILVFWLKRPRR